MKVLLTKVNNYLHLKTITEDIKIEELKKIFYVYKNAGILLAEGQFRGYLAPAISECLSFMDKMRDDTLKAIQLIEPSFEEKNAETEKT